MENEQPKSLEEYKALYKQNEAIKEKEDAEKRKKTYEALQDFFKTDMKVKEKMLNLAPTEMDDYDEESRIEYVNKLNDFLAETEVKFDNIAKNLNFRQDAKDAIKDYFDNAKQSLLVGNYQKGIGQDVYKSKLSNMDEKLIEETRDKMAGYMSVNEDVVGLINKSNSMNELLHVMHSYITNNEELLQAMPIVDSKENQYKQQITLYGEQTELSQKLFDNFPPELVCGTTDIVSMKNKVIMMIRERGHALSIDIDDLENESDILVKYFVPKLCNEDMIKNLPGIDKINTSGANGMFTAKREDISKQLFEFIEKVPTDQDIPRNHSNTNERNFVKEDAEEITKGKERRMSKISEIINKLKARIQERTEDKGKGENDGESRD